MNINEVAGFMVLSPYVLFDIGKAFPVSIGIALCLLFILGVATAEISKIHPFRKGVVMALVGGVAISIGIFAGYAIQMVQGINV